jgi:hypothetical protein
MVQESSLSVVANHLRNLLATRIDGIDDIIISHPKDANPKDSSQSLNLFFYKVDNSGYPADTGSDDPFYVRLNFLITAYGVSKTVNGVKISSGENDLRLVGEVMRVLHESPIMIISGNNGAPVMHLQTVMLPLTLDDINHIWSTQGDTPYRLSVAYEMALLPVPRKKPVRKEQLVGSTGVDARRDITVPPLPEEGFGVSTSSPEVRYKEVNTNDARWAPHICFLTDDGKELRYVQSLPHTTEETELEILVAGKANAGIKLVWETWQEWDGKTKKGGWSEPVPDGENPEITIPDKDADDEPIVSNVIDPDNIETALKHTVQLPFDPAEQVRAQAVLYAVREMDGAMIRSNPLLVSIYHNETGGGS